MKVPAPSISSSVQQAESYRIQKTNELQKEIEKLQDQMDQLQSRKDALPDCPLEGLSMKTKAFGTVSITRQQGASLYFAAGGKEREFIVPDCISNGFLIPEDPVVKERYNTEALLLQQLEVLDRQQRILNFELKKYQQ